ncbi:MAG: hypothetical protein M1832_002713 [Thelocarpon impressellum]|nr:MAG: hypothetical protein M1832_002713 [Thelocarpon impressellum]
MNPFRKKTKEVTGAVQSPAAEAARPPKAAFAGKSFKRTKKSKPPPKPEIDLEHALPATDDFRTSLLMPNLSARFSMLREQDNPNSKLGKAADDSVLLPRRASRMDALSDIAEVDSIRPPFAYGRTNSYASDGYGTDDDSNSGSMLNRAKPGEGNNLFGGRQKIYKIPTGASASSKDLSSTSAKFLYENDVSLSAFQKLREKERERERALDREREDLELQDRFNAQPRGRVPSPPLGGYNRNRETSSSTTSAPSVGRISTAATSIASQGGTSVYGGPAPALPNGPGPGLAGLERSTTKSRRLYEHGLDQHLHDQQSSAMTRLDQLARQRTHGAGTPPPVQYHSLSQTNSLSNLNERYERSGVSRSPSTGMRAASPAPSVLSPNFSSFHFGVGDPKAPENRAAPGFFHAPPLSPPHSEGEEAQGLGLGLPGAVHPSDRGKATALGTFHKPAGQYDEKKYSQRQLQMQQGRESPSPHRMSPPQHSAPSTESASLRGRSGPTSRSGSESSGSSRNLQVQPRKSSEAEGSRPPSRTNGYLAPVEERHTFLARPSISDVSSAEESETEGERLVTMDDPSAFRLRGNDTVVDDEPLTPQLEQLEHRPSEPEWMRRDLTPKPLLRPAAQPGAPVQPKKAHSSLAKRADEDDDSPTLGPDPADLSGLVRQHLRNDSGSSSVYGAPSPVNSQFTVHETRRGDVAGSRLTNTSAYSNENPWQGEWDGGYTGETDSAKPTSQRRSNGSAPRSTSSHSKRQDSQDTLPHGDEPIPTEARAAHGRGPSTATQKERADFEDELAHRRRMVQENLRGHEQQGGPPAGPVPGPLSHGQSRGSPSKTGGILKNKGPGPGPGPADGSAKAMKMLGISGPETNAERSPGRRPDEDRMRTEEERTLRSAMRGPKPAPSPQAVRAVPQVPPSIPSQRGRRQPHSVSPPSTRGSDTSSSRSGSRNGPVAEGRPSQERMHPPSRPLVPGKAVDPRQLRSPEFNHAKPPGPPPAPPGPPPSNARPMPTGFSESRQMHPLQTNALAPIGVSPRPSPQTPFSANSTPSLINSSASSPAIASPASVDSRAGAQTYSRVPPHHKRPVNKADISEPTFVSCTSSILTVSLPAGASHGAGPGETAPPLPPINPLRRRLQNTQAVLNPFSRGPKTTPSPAQANGGLEERSRFSDHDADERPSWQRHKLRKSSSDGANLHVRAAHQPLQLSAPAVPPPMSPRGTPGAAVSPPRKPAADGSMF